MLEALKIIISRHIYDYLSKYSTYCQRMAKITGFVLDHLLKYKKYY